MTQALKVLQNEAFIDADFLILSLDLTFVKACPNAADALKKRTAGVGRTKGAKQLATKVRAIVADPTITVALKISSGNVGDAPVGRKL